MKLRLIINEKNIIKYYNKIKYYEKEKLNKTKYLNNKIKEYKNILKKKMK